VSASDVVSLALSAGFGVVSSIGVAYQIKDIRNKSGRTEQPVLVGAGGTGPPIGFPPGSPPLGPHGSTPIGFPGPAVASAGPYGGPPPPGVHPLPPPPGHPSGGPMPAVGPYPGPGPMPAPPMSGPPSSPAGPLTSPVGPLTEPPTTLIPGGPGYRPPLSSAAFNAPGTFPPVAPGSAPPYPMSPAAGPAPFPAPPAYPQTAYTVPPAAGYVPPGAYALIAPETPRSVARIRLLLLAISILMIPNVALWMYTSILTGNFSDQSFSDPTTYLAIAVAMLILIIPLGTVPTVLSWQIGRGRNWARIASVVVFVLIGPFCSCFGVFLPFSRFGVDGSVSTSPLMDAGLGIFSLALGAASIAVVAHLFLPTANQYFRAMAQWRQAKAALTRRA
jgi:hypothetical protein